MYEAFYGLSNDPFRLLPDAGICFPHRSCAQAWAYLRYALKRGEGVVVVTGPPGSGKTTLADRLINELNPSKTVSVRMVASDLESIDLLRKLAYSFGLPAEGMDVALLTHRLERYLIELEHSQRRALLMIDEAHKLSNLSLEGLRILTDLQSRSRPVLQLFLLGQENLEEVLQVPGMEQFQQRVIASCRLQRMDLAETKSYMEYRLAQADWRGDPSFNGPAVLQIFRYSQGLPRHVNKICSRLLLHGSSEEKHALEASDVQTVVQDMHSELLAPLSNAAGLLEGAAEVSEEKVAQLALVPPPKIQQPPPRIENSREEMNALFLTEEQARRAERLDDERNAARAAGRRLPPHRHNGARRSFAIRRAVFHAAQMPGKLLSRGMDATKESLPRYAKALNAQLSKQAAAANTLWTRGRERIAAMSAKDGAESALPANKVPLALAAGVVAAVLVGVVWMNAGDDTSEVAAEGGSDRAGSRGATGLPAGDLANASVLHHDKYVDAAALQGGVLGSADAGPLGATGLTLLNSGSDASPWRLDAGHISFTELRNERFDRMSGTDAEVDSKLAVKVANDIAGPLLGRVAEVTSSLDVWGLAKLQATARKKSNAPASGDARPVAAKTEAQPGAEQSVTQVQPADHDAGESEEESDNIALVVSSERNSAPGFVEFLPAPAAGIAKQNTGGEAEDMAGANATVTTSDGGNTPIKVQVASLDARQLSATTAAQDATDIVDPRVVRNLGLAAEAFDDDRLLIPEATSAYTYYQRALDIDADNADALAGMQKIAKRYNALAWGALRGKSYDRANLFVDRGLRVQPNDRELLAMRNRIGDAVAQQRAAANAHAEAQARAVRESERARQAAAAERERERQRQQARQQAPSENAFQRLMRMMDGR